MTARRKQVESNIERKEKMNNNVRICNALAALESGRALLEDYADSHGWEAIDNDKHLESVQRVAKEDVRKAQAERTEESARRAYESAIIFEYHVNKTY